jgi:hypothetical protein
MAKKETTKKQEETKDYSQYTFRPNADLTVSATVLNIVRQFCEEIISKENIGVIRMTRPRYQYLNNKTGQPSKKGTKQDKLEKDYTYTYNHAATMQAQPEEHLLEMGKKSLALIEVLNSVHRDNVDLGNGILKATLEKEIKGGNNPLLANLKKVEDSEPAPKATVIVDEQPREKSE